jgi:hypothetical protein
LLASVRIIGFQTTEAGDFTRVKCNKYRNVRDRNNKVYTARLNTL